MGFKKNDDLDPIISEIRQEIKNVEARLKQRNPDRVITEEDQRRIAKNYVTKNLFPPTSDGLGLMQEPQLAQKNRTKQKMKEKVQKEMHPSHSGAHHKKTLSQGIKIEQKMGM
ncbi:MAG: hypothetical protein J5966_05905 [Lachnospiraceae bacterium]|nr:hypothetical protein [Lachnospiraceae bacterium]